MGKKTLYYRQMFNGHWVGLLEDIQVPRGIIIVVLGLISHSAETYPMITTRLAYMPVSKLVAPMERWCWASKSTKWDEEWELKQYIIYGVQDTFLRNLWVCFSSIMQYKKHGRRGRLWGDKEGNYESLISPWRAHKHLQRRKWVKVDGKAWNSQQGLGFLVMQVAANRGCSFGVAVTLRSKGKVTWKTGILPQTWTICCDLVTCWNCNFMGAHHWGRGPCCSEASIEVAG